jgi:hypothetical protein
MNIFKKAWNFTKAAAEFLKEGQPIVEEAVYNKRMKACLECPNLAEDNTCNLCGCFMPRKAGWATSFCVDSPRKWDKEIIGKNGKKIDLRNAKGKDNNTEASNKVQPTSE